MLADNSKETHRMGGVKSTIIGCLLVMALVVPIVCFMLIQTASIEQSRGAGVEPAASGVQPPVEVYRAERRSELSDPVEVVPSDVGSEVYMPASDHGLYVVDPAEAAKAGGQVVFTGSVSEQVSKKADVVIYVNYGCDQSEITGAYLTSPAGVRYDRYFFYDNGTDRFLCFSIDMPEAGEWALALQGSGNYLDCVFGAEQSRDFIKGHSKPYRELLNEVREDSTVRYSAYDEFPSLTAEEDGELAESGSE